MLSSSSSCPCPWLAMARLSCCNAACFADVDDLGPLLSTLKLRLLHICVSELLHFRVPVGLPHCFTPADVPGAATIIVANATASASAASLAQLACESLLHLWRSHPYPSASVKLPSHAPCCASTQEVQQPADTPHCTEWHLSSDCMLCCTQPCHHNCSRPVCCTCCSHAWGTGRGSRSLVPCRRPHRHHSW